MNLLFVTIEHSQLRNYVPEFLDLESSLVCAYSTERGISLLVP
jgi:hypothetical protein